MSLLKASDLLSIMAQMRRSGSTRALMKAITPDSLVFVGNAQMAKHLQNEIALLKGVQPKAILSIDDGEKLTGLYGPILFDTSAIHELFMRYEQDMQKRDVAIFEARAELAALKRSLKGEVAA